MQKILIVISLLLSFSCYSFTTKVSQADPYVMIEEVAQITFDRFAREKNEINKNPEILKDIVREELMPYISYKYASLKVLGSHAKKTPRADVLEFMEAFKEYLITSYAQVFTLYNDQQVVFEPDKKIDQQKIVLVGVNIIDSKRPPINIKFKVRKFSRKDASGKVSHYDWEAFDLVAEGISLLDAKQKELRSILAQNGVAKVTEMLKEKSDRKIVFSDILGVKEQLDAEDKN